MRSGIKKSPALKERDRTGQGENNLSGKMLLRYRKTGHTHDFIKGLYDESSFSLH